MKQLNQYEMFIHYQFRRIKFRPDENTKNGTWTVLVHGRVHWHILVDMAINAVIYIKGGEFIDSRSDSYFLKSFVIWIQISFVATLFSTVDNMS